MAARTLPDACGRHHDLVAVQPSAARLEARAGQCGRIAERRQQQRLLLLHGAEDADGSVAVGHRRRSRACPPGHQVARRPSNAAGCGPSTLDVLGREPATATSERGLVLSRSRYSRRTACRRRPGRGPPASPATRRGSGSLAQHHDAHAAAIRGRCHHDLQRCNDGRAVESPLMTSDTGPRSRGATRPPGPARAPRRLGAPWTRQGHWPGTVITSAPWSNTGVRDASASLAGRPRHRCDRRTPGRSRTRAEERAEGARERRERHRDGLLARDAQRDVIEPREREGGRAVRARVQAPVRRGERHEQRHRASSGSWSADAFGFATATVTASRPGAGRAQSQRAGASSRSNPLRAVRLALATVPRMAPVMTHPS